MIAGRKKHIQFTKQALKFLEGLPSDALTEFRADFEVLARDGYLEFPEGRKLCKSLFEVRVAMDGNAYRTLYCYAKGEEIWVLSGFVKKTQQTPLQEIAKAWKIKRSMGL